MTLKNDRFLRAIWREPLDRTPIWIMRQAGRYLPEYRATRAQAGSFMTLCQTPELACEVTLQPIRRYPLDAAILFSDILTIPDAMGLGLSFQEGEGPRFAQPLQTEKAIQDVTVAPLEKLAYVYDTIRLVKHELTGKVPLIGFCGSPWTVAAYAVEGRAVPGFPTLMKLLQTDPFLLHQLLDCFAQSICLHLNAQIQAGVDAIMLFDTWGGMLDTKNYEEFSLYYVKQILAGLLRRYNDKKIPVILFTKGGGKWLEVMAKTTVDVLGVDWTISLGEARARVGKHVALQGNMDPALLLQTPEVIQEQVKAILQSYGTGSGHVFNLGHGITPDVAPEQVAVLVDAVHNFSQR